MRAILRGDRVNIGGNASGNVDDRVTGSVDATKSGKNFVARCLVRGH
jgi:hypothetical protein